MVTRVAMLNGIKLVILTRAGNSFACYPLYVCLYVYVLSSYFDVLLEEKRGPAFSPLPKESMRIVLDQARQATHLKKRYKANPDWPRRIPVGAEHIENIWRNRPDNDDDVRSWQMGEGEVDVDEIVGEDPELKQAWVHI
jgi:hypothetical protein